MEFVLLTEVSSCYFIGNCLREIVFSEKVTRFYVFFVSVVKVFALYVKVLSNLLFSKE